MDILNRTILFSSLPERRTMCSMTSYINTMGTQNTSKSSFHWQIFRCRQLVFMEPDILASPVPGKELAIYIVMTDEYFRSGKLQMHLEKLSMTMDNPLPVTNTIYETCFRYTLTARISPLWNQVDSCLIQGRDFLTSTSVMNAIKLEMIIRDEEMFLSVWPLRVKLPLMSQEHLDMENNRDLSVYVLPSMKRGFLKSVTSELPMSCPYRTYKELKRHWKNMYGYRLPEEPDHLFYCSLTFNSMSSTPYTYPSLCVRKCGLVFLRCQDHMAILQKFITDLTTKLPTVCGKPFGMDSRVMCAVPKLCQSSENLGQANLSDVPEKQLPDDQFKYVSSITKLQKQPPQTDVSSPIRHENPLPSASFSCRSTQPVDIFSINSGFGVRSLQQNRMVSVFKPNIVSLSPASVMDDMSQRFVPSSSFNNFQHLTHVYPSASLQLKDGGKKKPRTRPQVQPDVDVEELARKRDLARVNTTTLVCWLRSKHVPCKVKDRKSDLVDKVMEYLNLPR